MVEDVEVVLSLSPVQKRKELFWIINSTCISDQHVFPNDGLMRLWILG